MRLPFLIGRAIFGGFFVMNGIHHFQKTREISEYVASKNLPKPDLAVRATGVMLLLGGASILLGIKPKIGTAAVIGFLAGVSPLMHDFWRRENPEQCRSELVNFTKNMALAGGAAALMGVEEPWPVSVPFLQPRGGRFKRALRQLAA